MQGRIATFKYVTDSNSNKYVTDSKGSIIKKKTILFYPFNSLSIFLAGTLLVFLYKAMACPIAVLLQHFYCKKSTIFGIKSEELFVPTRIFIENATVSLVLFYANRRNYTLLEK